MIQSFGLFWKLKDVNFGKQQRGGKGNIFGVKASEKRSDKKDFWDSSVIYALYSNFELVYVGQAKKFGQRLRHHKFDHLSDRFDTFSWFEISEKIIESEKPGTIMNHFEAILIYVSEPKLNRQGGKIFTSGKYLQKLES